MIAGRAHALKVACESLPTASDDEKAYIAVLMGDLEQNKVELASASFNLEDTLTGFVSRFPCQPQRILDCAVATALHSLVDCNRLSFDVYFESHKINARRLQLPHFG